MYLKNIEVHGFKSFANKIDFTFHNGITGIVGPNGSGKSNVADAVRWVLGEQSARQLRGASMQDVIFSGTQNRRPMGCASVAITLDNSDHQLAIDFEEVTVTRRVFRSGESEYLINGTPCRLKDINELFYDTGIGKEGYSIIGQGQIDRILSGKPEDRRELFDEAAGIVKFKRRKAISLKKLGDEENNLTRVNDILSEMETRVAPLESQSEKAKVYLKKKEELKRLDINTFLLETKSLEEQLIELNEKHVIAQKDLKENTEKFEGSRDEFDEMQSEMNDLDEQLEQRRQRMSDTKVTRQKLEGQIALLNEQINSLRTSDEQFESRINTLNEQLSQKEAELKEAKKNRDAAAKAAGEALEKKEDAKESAQALTATIQHLTKDIEKNKESVMEAMNAKSDVNSRLSSCDASIEQINIRKAELSSRLLRAKTDEEEMESQYKRYESEFQQVCSKLAKMDESIEENESSIHDISASIHDKEDERRALESSYHEVNSKLESMRNIAERYEGYGSATRRIMEKKDKRVHGVVADILKVDKKYETAIETALGGNIQNIVTQDEDCAKDMIAFLKENKLGRATFLPLTSVKEREFNAPDALKEKGALGLADTLVKTDDKYKNVASHLLHNYIVVDNVDNALKMARKFNFTLRCVTLSGEALNPGGSISGGAFKNSSNLLGRNREMEELKKELEKKKAELDKLFADIEKLRKDRNELRDKNTVLKEQQQELFIEQNTAKMQLNQAKARQEEAKQGYYDLHAEEKDIASQLLSVENEKRNISKELSDFERNEEDTKKKIEELSKVLAVRQEKESVVLAQLSSLEVESAQLTQKEQFENENVERISDEYDRIKNELTFTKESVTGSKDEIKRKQESIEELKKTIEASVVSDKEDDEFILAAQEKKEELAKRQKEFMTRRDSLSSRMNSLDKEVLRLSNMIDKLQETRQSHFTYMWNEYEITMSQAKEMRDETLTDLPAMKREIIAIKGSIRELGDVNVNAIEEYTQLMERYDFMRKQRDDIVEAKESLQKIIQELDEGMRKQFTEKFDQIAKQFDKVFKEMFGGGTGTLELMEDEDILEAGIKIIAQPPGKKLQNMMQLSGGEKALTAIALLFAIQNLKPSPFCLLDEIEAALDESNVGRFASYLKKLTRATQFIVITHRRGTMEKADRLYGITMQEKGVSALVSVDLIDDKDLK